MPWTCSLHWCFGMELHWDCSCSMFVWRRVRSVDWNIARVDRSRAEWDACPVDDQQDVDSLDCKPEQCDAEPCRNHRERDGANEDRSCISVENRRSEDIDDARPREMLLDKDSSNPHHRNLRTRRRISEGATGEFECLLAVLAAISSMNPACGFDSHSFVWIFKICFRA